jgi:hypothetical protein
MFEQKSTESVVFSLKNYDFETAHTSTIQKGEKLPFDFLLAEFRKDNLIIRIRFRVVQKRCTYGLRIMESGSKWSEASQVRDNRVEIGSSISQQQLYEALTEHLSASQRVSSASITFRWENNSLKMPIDRL